MLKYTSRWIHLRWVFIHTSSLSNSSRKRQLEPSHIFFSTVLYIYVQNPKSKLLSVEVKHYGVSCLSRYFFSLNFKLHFKLWCEKYTKTVYKMQKSCFAKTASNSQHRLYCPFSYSAKHVNSSRGCLNFLHVLRSSKFSSTLATNSVKQHYEGYSVFYFNYKG